MRVDLSRCNLLLSGRIIYGDEAMSQEEKVERLKAIAFQEQRKAEKAAYEYFCACDLGEEREWAHEFYEAIRTAAQTATIVA